MFFFSAMTSCCLAGEPAGSNRAQPVVAAMPNDGEIQSCAIDTHSVHGCFQTYLLYYMSCSAHWRPALTSPNGCFSCRHFWGFRIKQLNCLRDCLPGCSIHVLWDEMRRRRYTRKEEFRIEHKGVCILNALRCISKDIHNLLPREQTVHCWWLKPSLSGGMNEWDKWEGNFSDRITQFFRGINSFNC